jgi:hypothetical protein
LQFKNQIILYNVRKRFEFANENKKSFVLKKKAKEFLVKISLKKKNSKLNENKE